MSSEIDLLAGFEEWAAQVRETENGETMPIHPKRGENAGRALDALKASGSWDPEDVDTSIADLLANLMHLVDYRQFCSGRMVARPQQPPADFDELLRRARNYHTVERIMFGVQPHVPPTMGGWDEARMGYPDHRVDDMTRDDEANVHIQPNLGEMSREEFEAYRNRGRGEPFEPEYHRGA